MDDGNAAEFASTSATPGVTAEMAEALIALRRSRTPIRPETPNVQFDFDLRNSVTGRQLASSPPTRSFYEFDMPTTTVASMSGIGRGIGRGTGSSVEVRPSYAATAFGAAEYNLSASAYRSTSTASIVTTAGLQSTREVATTTSYSVPITRVRESVALPTPGSISEEYVAKLEERVQVMERLLTQTQSSPELSTRSNETVRPSGESAVARMADPTSTRRPGEPSPEVVRENYGRTDATKPYLPSVKLGTYKGDTSLETFIAKFENCSRYLNWSERDRFFYLSNALEGAAGQVLWDAATCSSVEALVQLLRNRFGNQNQTERFRAELKVRRRRPGETLQKLYQDVCKLMALAYPVPRMNCLM